uniref:Tc1-like transposase DDE domain-containing protein n=1 Tax=Esox lucius TaxID=8010 RepID=A0A3P8YI50_ESOLU
CPLMDLMPPKKLTKADFLRDVLVEGLGVYIHLYPTHWPGTDDMSIKVWMEDHQIKNLSWPAQSPELNPIENLWNLIKRKMDGHKPSNKAKLLEFLFPSQTGTKLGVGHFCRDLSVCFQAYSSLGKAALLSEPEVMAEGHSRSAVQVLLRWATQQGVVELPWSSQPERSYMDSGTRFCKRDLSVV